MIVGNAIDHLYAMAAAIEAKDGSKHNGMPEVQR